MAKRPHRRTNSQHKRLWLKLYLTLLPGLKGHFGQTWRGCHVCRALNTGFPHCITMEGSGSQPPLVAWWVLFCFEISALEKTSAALSAPQRPIATHRTTATPKAGPGVVRKNPGVGNGDDEAAELMQQVGPSCAPDWSQVSGEDASCTDQKRLACVLVEDLRCLLKQSSS